MYSIYIYLLCRYIYYTGTSMLRFLSKNRMVDFSHKQHVTSSVQKYNTYFLSVQVKKELSKGGGIRKQSIICRYLCVYSVFLYHIQYLLYVQQEVYSIYTKQIILFIYYIFIQSGSKRRSPTYSQIFDVFNSRPSFKNRKLICPSKRIQLSEFYSKISKVIVHFPG